LKAQLPSLLGRNVLGVYLYGSLTHGAFNPERSDVDGIVVTHRPLNPGRFKALKQWLSQMAKTNPWTSRLQLIFLIENHVLSRDAEACLYQFGRLTRGTSDGNPIIWMEALKSGVVLVGPRPHHLVPPITTDRLR